METDIKNFNGSVVIQIKALENTKNITLHSADLEIDDWIYIANENNQEIKISSIAFDIQRQFLIIFLEQELVRNEIYKLVINQFFGMLQKDNEGFYLAKYIDEYGIERYNFFIFFMLRTLFSCLLKGVKEFRNQKFVFVLHSNLASPQT